MFGLKACFLGVMLALVAGIGGYFVGYRAGENSVTSDWQAANIALEKETARRVAEAAALDQEYQKALRELENVNPKDNGDVAPVLRNAIAGLH